MNEGVLRDYNRLVELEAFTIYYLSVKETADAFWIEPPMGFCS